MGTGRGRFGVLAAAALAWALTGCGGDGDGVRHDGSGGGDRPPAETRQRPTTPPTSTTTAEAEAEPEAEPEAADKSDDNGRRGTAAGPATGTGTGTGPCFDGRCELTVSEPLSIEVDSRFGVGDLRVTKITDDAVVLRSSGAGTHLSSSIGEGGTGGLNGLGFRVKSLEGGTAVLQFFPRA
ncbi:hypothetical protein [Streptomyces sp. MB09-02B]|uniref:hypothetical protein n=1 Tax=Streptomyces sp. MB09-02B TaxID=3028667 RepID=UPI0029AA044B|nr:hypothetical protein [Streptomyces sp. MB09-02B]MDX3637880.1 hypothetical protein [Streptomyces sp. MB09-02B]